VKEGKRSQFVPKLPDIIYGRPQGESRQAQKYVSAVRILTWDPGDFQNLTCPTLHVW